jgi:hypothetical protein
MNKTGGYLGTVSAINFTAWVISPFHFRMETDPVSETTYSF